MHVYMPGRGVHEILEFYARAPLAARPEMWADKLIGQSRDGFAFLLEGGASEYGHLAVCTPGKREGIRDGAVPLRQLRVGRCHGPCRRSRASRRAGAPAHALVLVAGPERHRPGE